MDAGDLHAGFRLGDWVVEPQLGRITGYGRSHPLAAHQLRILEALASRQGRVVDRQFLRDNAWPGQHATDEMVRAAIRELREILGDSPSDPRHIFTVGKRGYTLVAPCEPLAAPRAGQPAMAPGAVVSPSIPRAQRFVAELSRRSVLKVSAAYVVGMLFVLQGAQTISAPLHFPDWWMTALTILAIAGLPIVATLAWSYEITPGGIVLDTGDTAQLKLPRARRAMAPALVTGVALLAGVTAVAYWRSLDHAPETAPRADEPSPQSIAVLPLVDMTPGGGNAYLGDGFSEEISAQLAQVPGLRVAARTSAFEFKDKRLDVRKIGEALGVHNVLEGSVRRDGDKLRVTVQLIDAKTGYHVWAGSYDREWADAIAIQDNISRSITKALEVVLTPDSERKLKRDGVANLAAYEQYLAGVSAMHQSADLSQANKAADLFRKALALDPGFARAHAGLCQVGIRRYNLTLAATDVAAAEESCRKALELDPSREETELALAALYAASGRYEQAEAVYRGLVARRPTDADVYIGLGKALSRQGRQQDAERNFRQAIEVEPTYVTAHSALGGFMFGAGRAEEAIREYTRATELAPGSAGTFSNLGAALFLAVRLKEAAKAFETSLALEPSRSAHANLGTLYYFLGDFRAAVRHYESAEAHASEDYRVVGGLADALWQLDGRRADAVRAYQRAVALAESSLKVNPSQADVWAQLAYYGGRVGDPQRAMRAQARAEALDDNDMYVHYFIALAEADRKDAAAATAAMERAEKSGYPRELLYADPVLRPLLPRKGA